MNSKGFGKISACPGLRDIDGSGKPIDGWTIFNKMFKPGDDLILIDEDDNFFGGKLIMAVEAGLILKIGIQKEKLYDWDDIRFISHDGFPVKKLMPSGSDRYIQQAFSSEIPELIRNILTKESCRHCKEIMERDVLKKHERRCSERPEPIAGTRSYYGGCPWRIEDVFSQIVNVGNCSDYFQYIDQTFLETAVLQSLDGANGLLWDLGSIYHFE